MTDKKARAQLLLPLRDRAQFLEQYFAKGESDGLFVPGELDVELGDDVDVELHFTDERVRFHIRALVKWKRTGGRRAIPPGVGIEFLGSEKSTVEQILRFAENRESVHHVERESRRYALQVDVKVKDASGVSTSGITDDISDGGCFVISDAVIAVGASVEIKIRAPNTLFGWLTIPGFVAWRREDAQRTGVGVEFQPSSERQRAKVRRIVELLKERNLRELRVRVPRTSLPPTQT